MKGEIEGEGTALAGGFVSFPSHVHLVTKGRVRKGKRRTDR